MAIQSNHHDHWIQGNREERVLIRRHISNDSDVTFRNVVVPRVSFPLPPTPPQSHSSKGCICPLLQFPFTVPKE